MTNGGGGKDGGARRKTREQKKSEFDQRRKKAESPGAREGYGRGRRSVKKMETTSIQKNLTKPQGGRIRILPPLRGVDWGERGEMKENGPCRTTQEETTF